MSWSKSASGTAEQVKGTCASWADEQRANDQGMSQEAIDGHQQQVQGAANCIVNPQGKVIGTGDTFREAIDTARSVRSGDQETTHGE